MTRFTFGEVEAVLAELNDIASDKRVAFSSRLKNLQKQGLKAEGASPGRGRTARLSFVDLVSLAAGVELLRLGLPPQRAASIISHSASSLLGTALWATFKGPQAERFADEQGIAVPDPDYVWLVTFDALAAMTNFGESEFDDFDAFDVLPVVDIQTLLRTGSHGYADKADGVGRRHLIINGSGLCRELVDIVCYSFRLGDAEDLREDVMAENRRLGELMEKLDASIRKAKDSLDQEKSKNGGS